jgi:hypothetical protein
MLAAARVRPCDGGVWCGLWAVVRRADGRTHQEPGDVADGSGSADEGHDPAPTKFGWLGRGGIISSCVINRGIPLSASPCNIINTPLSTHLLGAVASPLFVEWWGMGSVLF